MKTRLGVLEKENLEQKLKLDALTLVRACYAVNFLNNQTTVGAKKDKGRAGDRGQRAPCTLGTKAERSRPHGRRRRRADVCQGQAKGNRGRGNCNHNHNHNCALCCCFSKNRIKGDVARGCICVRCARRQVLCCEKVGRGGCSRCPQGPEKGQADLVQAGCAASHPGQGQDLCQLFDERSVAR